MPRIVMLLMLGGFNDTPKLGLLVTGSSFVIGDGCGVSWLRAGALGTVTGTMCTVVKYQENRFCANRQPLDRSVFIKIYQNTMCAISRLAVT